MLLQTLFRCKLPIVIIAPLNCRICPPCFDFHGLTLLEFTIISFTDKSEKKFLTVNPDKMEKITVNDSRMYSLVFLYDLHTKLYFNVLDGISDTDAHNRINTKANHIAWIAGSLMNGRYELAHVLGIELKATSPDFFKEFKGIQDGITYPSLAEYKKDWENISPVFRNALVNVNTGQLDGDDPFGMSGDSGEKLTFFDTIAFIIDRESYCLGQIGIYRRFLGYEAMKYT